MTPAARVELAIQLRREGLSWRLISARLGYAHPSGAYNAALNLTLAQYRANLRQQCSSAGVYNAPNPGPTAA